MTAAIYGAAALAEIAGCFAFWAWARLQQPVWWLIPGLVSLALFAWLLTLVDVPAAGRAYAAYGGIYILASLGWLWAVEGLRPDRFDVMGALLCLAGAGHPARATHRLMGLGCGGPPLRLAGSKPRKADGVALTGDDRHDEVCATMRFAMRHRVNAALAGAIVTASLGLAGTAATAQNSAGCSRDYAMLSRDDFIGRPVPTYCAYGYGPGMPYSAGPQAGVVERNYAPRRLQRHRTASRPARRGIVE